MKFWRTEARKKREEAAKLEKEQSADRKTAGKVQASAVALKKQATSRRDEQLLGQAAALEADAAEKAEEAESLRRGAQEKQSRAEKRRKKSAEAEREEARIAEKVRAEEEAASEAAETHKTLRKKQVHFLALVTEVEEALK